MSAVFYSHGKKYRLGLGPNANEHYEEGTSLREAFGRREAGADGVGGGSRKSWGWGNSGVGWREGFGARGREVGAGLRRGDSPGCQPQGGAAG